MPPAQHVALTVSSSDSVYTLRLKVFSSASLRCQPGQLRLFHGAQMLDCGDLTLEMVGVKAGDDVFFDLGEDDELQAALEVSARRAVPEEKGFSGSALLGATKPDAARPETATCGGPGPDKPPRALNEPGDAIELVE
jgi:hypothetical protein